MQRLHTLQHSGMYTAKVETSRKVIRNCCKQVHIGYNTCNANIPKHHTVAVGTLRSVTLISVFSSAEVSAPYVTGFNSESPVSTSDKAMMRNPIRGRVHQNNGEAHSLFLSVWG